MAQWLVLYWEMASKHSHALKGGIKIITSKPRKKLSNEHFFFELDIYTPPKTRFLDQSKKLQNNPFFFHMLRVWLFSYCFTKEKQVLRKIEEVFSQKIKKTAVQLWFGFVSPLVKNRVLGGVFWYKNV